MHVGDANRELVLRGVVDSVFCAHPAMSFAAFWTAWAIFC